MSCDFGKRGPCLTVRGFPADSRGVIRSHAHSATSDVALAERAPKRAPVLPLGSGKRFRRDSGNRLGRTDSASDARKHAQTSIGKPAATGKCIMYEDPRSSVREDAQEGQHTSTPGIFNMW